MINYESPVFVNIVLCTIYVLVGIAVVLTVCSAVRSLLVRGRSEAKEHGIPTGRIALGTAVLLIVTLIVTWLAGSEKPLIVNGEVYDNTFWLRTSDMFIGSAAILLAIVIGIIGVLTFIGFIRKRKDKSYV